MTEVTDDYPDSPFRTTGTDHVTVWGSNAENVLSFYRDLLGMRLVLRQPNLDDPSQTHLFLDTGDGTVLTFFVSEDASHMPVRNVPTSAASTISRSRSNPNVSPT